MKEKRDVRSWLSTAVAGIRFKPDRAAVEQELREHIEDKTADLMRIFPGMTEAEAEARALSGMGDPDEVGRELAKIHRPWLGYLWQFSRALLWMALIAWVVQIVFLAGVSREDGWNGELGGWYSPGHEEVLDGNVVELEPDQKVISIDGDSLTMERAVLKRMTEDYIQLGVKLRVISPAFWAGRSHSLTSFVTATDDRGNYHPSSAEFWADGLSIGDRPINYVNYGASGYGPFYRDYILWVYDVDPEARWVHLEYDWMGRQFAFIVDLTKEAGA